MGDKPLLNYAFTDTSGNRFPMANASFVYGTIEISSDSITGLKWSSLPVSIPYNLFSNNKISNLVSVSPEDNKGLLFNLSGIYQITTTLQFTMYSTSTSQQSFAFSYSTLPNSVTASNTLSATTNGISGPISIPDITYSDNGNKAWFITGSSSGGGIGTTYNSVNYGGNVTVLPTTFSPFFVLPNIISSTNKNVNTIISIYYIPAGTKIYFNIANTTTTTTTINATGNFTLRLLNDGHIYRDVFVSSARSWGW